MSRTIRRKSTAYNLNWALRDYVWDEAAGHFKRMHIDRHSAEGKKLLAKYHSDHGFGDYAHACPPRWYRRILNRKASMKEKQHMHRWVRNPDFEVPKPVRVSDADRYW